jgi:16S rRNA (adenine1518-N6/adenine1519-N6)-dimethyltransferase
MVAFGDRSRPPRPRPLRRYGQNHLVDANVLRAIVEQAGVGPADVVLEVGAADGRLTRPLLERAAVVHAFEIDGRFLPRLQALADERPGLRLHQGDALRARLDLLDPAPTTLVSNLAYNIAIPLIMTTIPELPSLERWSVMVQRELAERLFAAPRTKAYAAVSVLTQCACELGTTRAVSRHSFRPRPNVDSSFISFSRRARAGGAWHVEGEELDAAGYAALDGLVRRAFAGRRKLLTTTLAGASRGGRSLDRDDVRQALLALGLAASARPEELAPGSWVRLARHLGWMEAT